MKFLKKSTPVTITIGPFKDKTDAVTAETGLTAAGASVFNIFKEGAVAAVDIKSETTFTHISGGVYTMTLSDDDTDTHGNLLIHYSKPDTCLDVFMHCCVMPANVFDSFFGSDKLQVDQAQWLGQAVTADDNNLPKVGIGAIDSSAPAAVNLAAGAKALVRGSVDDVAATTTSFVTDLTETTTDHYEGRSIVFLSGVLLGQAQTITAYDGATKTLTVNALTEAPGDGDLFVIA